MERFLQRCRQDRIRITPQREAIYRVVKDAHEHPYAQRVYRKVKPRFRSISFDTVNRTLELFVRMGLLKTVEGSGQPKRFDADLGSHSHFRCTRCNTIFDFSYGPYERLTVPRKISTRHSVRSVSVVIEGICERCSRRKPAPKEGVHESVRDMRNQQKRRKIGK
ncbi:MAG: transcriptional repressor [Candidatus Omnitrophica bacterium]|nr:transcriptional repressor [Candidatus Omnitrophota bacterium]